MSLIDRFIDGGESFPDTIMHVGMDRLSAIDGFISAAGQAFESQLQAEAVAAPIHQEVNVAPIQMAKTPEITTESAPVLQEVTPEVEITEARRPRPFSTDDNGDEEQGRQERLQAAEEVLLQAYDSRPDERRVA